MRHPFKARELATVLAALRNWQHTYPECLRELPEWEVATKGGAIDPLTTDEINALCEWLNVREPIALPSEELCILVLETWLRSIDWDAMIEKTSSGVVFVGSQLSAVTSCGYADALERDIPSRILRYGWHSWENPGCAVCESEDGWEIALLDGRWILDWWACELGLSKRCVWDLESAVDAEEIERLYGKRDAWERSPVEGREA